MRTPRLRRPRAVRLAALGLLLAGCGEITSFSLSISTWGGSHIAIEITVSGGTVLYDCAMGRIDQPIEVRNGNFDVTGVHWPGQGGPIGVDTTRAGRPARYLGTVRGDRMTLTVILTDTGETLGLYQLRKGASPLIVACL
ncbi:MAG TPA: hypothetical protein VF862_01400 [Gemmatimonadales bacterium]